MRPRLPEVLKKTGDLGQEKWRGRALVGESPPEVSGYFGDLGQTRGSSLHPRLPDDADYQRDDIDDAAIGHAAIMDIPAGRRRPFDF